MQLHMSNQVDKGDFYGVPLLKALSAALGLSSSDLNMYKNVYAVTSIQEKLS